MAVHADCLSAFRSETNSEVTITCGVRRWKAHRDVVCSGSKVFEKALNGGFKVSKSSLSAQRISAPHAADTPWQEGKTNVIELKEEEPELVERMLLYLFVHRVVQVCN